MTPKDKAKELYDRFNQMLPLIEQTTGKKPSDCAIVAVEEIISETLSEYTNDENHCRILFWEEVKLQLRGYA